VSLETLRCLLSYLIQIPLNLWVPSVHNKKPGSKEFPHFRQCIRKNTPRLLGLDHSNSLQHLAVQPQLAMGRSGGGI
jgi:hypothetical protein